METEHVHMWVVYDPGKHVPGDPLWCAIALTLDNDPDIWCAYVTKKEIRFSRSSTYKRYTYEISDAALEFIKELDTKFQADPFELILTSGMLRKIRDVGGPSTMDYYYKHGTGIPTGHKRSRNGINNEAEAA